MIEIVRVFLGREWKPKDIGIIPNNAASRFIREQFPTSRIRPAQPYSYFTLDNALLGLPPLSRDPDIAELSDVDIEPVANDFVGSLEQILSSYALESKLSVEFAAELCNTSKRTLQRRLSESGSRYSEILDKARFQVASRLLIDPDLKVTDVSRLLGYSDPTHFSRAFRRVAGLNPRGYRQGLTR